MDLSARTLLESRLAVETPEGVELQITPAGPAARAVAYLIDSLLRATVVILISMLFSLFGLFGRGLLLMTLFLAEWFYPVLFEVFWQGATPGKRAMKLRVLHDNGTPVTFAGSMIRNLLRGIDWLPLCYAAGLISSLLNVQFKRIGDLAAGTIVVYDLPPQRAPEQTVSGIRKLPVKLSADEQRLIMAFAERCPSLSASRQLELAAPLAPMLGCSVEDSVLQLQQIANGLVGRR